MPEEVTTWLLEPGGSSPIGKVAPNGAKCSIVSHYLGTPTEMYTEAGVLAWKAQLDLYGVPSVEVGTRARCAVPRSRLRQGLRRALRAPKHIAFVLAQLAREIVKFPNPRPSVLRHAVPEAVRCVYDAIDGRRALTWEELSGRPDAAAHSGFESLFRIAGATTCEGPFPLR
jgi:hypothetical protein